VPSKRGFDLGVHRRDDLLVWFLFPRLYEPERFGWVEVEDIVRWVAAGFRAFRAAILCRTASSLGPCPAYKVAGLEMVGSGIATLREIRRPAFLLRRVRSRTKSLTVLLGT